MSVEYRNVRLTAEAYEKLERRKRDDETFSEAVARLAAERPIADLAGVLTDEEVEGVRARRRDAYERYAERRSE